MDQGKKKKIVYSYYVMDIVHKGHILHMKNSKAIAGKDGISIIGILTDKAAMEKKPRPTLSFDERMDIAKAIKYADVVVPQDTYSPLPNIKKLRPHVAMESASHAEEDITELREFMESIGGEVIMLPYYPPQSSTNIKNKIRNNTEQ
jgi:cytidyltransferase-like protein